MCQLLEASSRWWMRFELRILLVLLALELLTWIF